MIKRVALPIAVALFGAAIVAQATSSAHPAADPAPAAAAAKPAAVPEELSPDGLAPLNHWFALGSGCRAKDDIPGDVTMETLPRDPARPNVYKVRFHLDSYKLDSRTLAGTEIPVKFARECSIRLNVNPPAGKTVTKVTAITKPMVESKAAGTKLTTVQELKIGKDLLGRFENVYLAGDKVENSARTVDLVPGTKADEKFPELACAEPKIIAYNFTWLAERATKDDEVIVHLDGDKTVDMEVEISACK